MADKKDGEEDGDDVWREAMRDVTPFSPAQREAVRPEKPPSSPRVPQVPRLRTPPAVASPAASDAELNPGLDRRTAERLRRGKMPVEATLDLHGYSRVQAYEALSRFILDSYASGLRCVLVITGKGGGPLRDPLSAGGGILRASVPEWLAESSLRGIILKTAPARPQHGGDGALYVLLRRQRAPL